MVVLGTTANVGIVLFAGDTVSEKRHLYRESAFRRSSLDVFRISFEERSVVYVVSSLTIGFIVFSVLFDRSVH